MQGFRLGQPLCTHPITPCLRKLYGRLEARSGTLEGGAYSDVASAMRPHNRRKVTQHTMNPTAERALSRYGDSVYRMALLREGDPARAAQATIIAWSTFPWQAAILDEALEARLIAALPPERRRRFFSRRRQTRLPELSAAFWRLAPATRVALSLRLTRGYDTTMIATALNRSTDETRELVWSAMTTLLGDDPATVAPECRQSRMARLDEPAADRTHLLQCAACRAIQPRWEAAERELAEAIARATGRMVLPRTAIQTIKDRLQDTPTTTPMWWRNPAILQAGVIAAVLLALVALILPGRRATNTGQPITTARDMVERALEQYGAAPDGIGIVHQQFHFDPGIPGGVIVGDVWTDATDPARHRMQLLQGRNIWDWQAGDGDRAMRYLSAFVSPYCGPSSTDLALATGHMYRWDMDADEQAAMRTVRWESGVWAIGQGYLNQALSADVLRSLGSVTEGDTQVLTLAAEGRTISGTLLLKLNAQSGALREIREVVSDSGVTEARIRWQLVAEERIDRTEALRQSLLTGYPAQSRPREEAQPAPILDRACPLWTTQHAWSLPKSLTNRWGAVIGLGALPAGIEQVYFAGPPRNLYAPPQSVDQTSAMLIYIGRGKRLILQVNPTALARVSTDTLLVPNGISAGPWQLQLASNNPYGLIRGLAVGTSVSNPLDNTQIPFSFVAHGWTFEELRQLLSTAKSLELTDWYAMRSQIYDPEPMSEAALDIVMPAVEQIAWRPGRVITSEIEGAYRSSPAQAGLDDPYHKPTDAWVATNTIQYTSQSQLGRYRSETRQQDDTASVIAWGDMRGSAEYDQRTNIVKRYNQFYFTSRSLTILDEPIATIIRIGAFQPTAQNADSVTLEYTGPITTTQLQFLAEQQRSMPAEWTDSSIGWPWIADLEPTTITYRATFNRATGMLTSFETFANTSTGMVELERLLVRQWEADIDPNSVEWTYTPPAGADELTIDYTSSYNGQPSVVSSLQEVLTVSEGAVWGWPVGQGNYLVRGLIPPLKYSAALSSSPQFDQAVSLGAIGLAYVLRGSDVYTLTQGSTQLMRTLLLQTPAPWTRSEQRKLMIGGAVRPAWVMRDEEQTRWIIFEIDDRLLVLEYAGRQETEDVITKLAELERLQ